MMKEAMKIKEQTDRQREDNNAIINEIKVQKKLLENKEIKLSEKEKKLELRKQDLQKEVSQQVLMEKLKTENQMEKRYKGLIFILFTYGIVFSLCVAYRNSVLKKDIFQIGNWIKNIFIFGDVINNLWKINLVIGAMVVLVIYAIIKVMVNVEDIVRRNYVLILISGGIGVALVVFMLAKEYIK